MFPYLFLIKTSLSDLAKNKIQTALTSLGIFVGVLAVVLLMAFGRGLKNYLVEQFESLGANVVYVYPGNILRSSSPGGGTLGGASFDERDLRTLQRVKNVRYLVPVYVKRATAEGGGDSQATDIYATTADIFDLRNLNIDQGRLFTNADVSKRAKVAVLGPEIATKLFGNSANAVGKKSEWKLSGLLSSG